MVVALMKLLQKTYAALIFCILSHEYMIPVRTERYAAAFSYARIVYCGNGEQKG